MRRVVDARDEGPQLERGLLLLAGGVMVVAFLLASLGMGHSWLRTVRILLVPAAFLLASFAMDSPGVRRARLILPIVAMLCGIGISSLWHVDEWQMSKQLLWLALGVTLMVGTYHLVPEAHGLARYKYVCGVVAAVLIIVTMIWGISATTGGPKLWLAFGPFRFQPAEAAKLLMAVFLAGFLAERFAGPQHSPRDPHRAVPSVRYMGPVLVVVALCLAMFVLQSDLGAAMLFFGLFVATLYVAVGRIRYVLLSIALFVAGAGVAYQCSAKVASRVDIWLNPWAAAEYGAGQIRQGLICFAEGGVFGAGPGLGMVKGLPAAGTDLIFAVMGEELGFAGCTAILLLYAMLVYRAFRIAWRCPDAFSSLLATALATVLAVQTLTIIGGVTGLIPLTGITLPFASYGGSSLGTNLVSVGLLLAVSREPSAYSRPIQPVSGGIDFRPNVRKLALALLCGFLALLLALTYWQVIAAARLQASPYNERPRARRAAVHRGSIFDRSGLVLAETQDLGSGLKQRAYPLDEAAAHVVGYSVPIHGQDGIERCQDDALTAGGPYRTWPKRPFAPRAVGCNVTLTLDAEAQRAVYEELAPRKGAVVALNPRTGEVLVMASAPSFSPALVDEEWDDIQRRRDASLVNRSAARTYRCTGVLHLAVAVAAMDSGGVRPSDPFQCVGSVDIRGVAVDCDGRRQHGRTDLAAALRLPCRTTLATLAARVGPAVLDTYIDRFGLRETPGIELAAHQPTVPLLSDAPPADFVAACLDGTRVRVTPLAMCEAVAAIANEGMRMRPYLLGSVTDVNGRVLRSAAPQQLGQVCRPAAAQEVAKVMVSALQRGMAERAGIAQVRVAGMAGSTRQADGSWAPWFIGFAPADHPKVAVAVVIEDGRRSGEQAADLTGRVLQAVLR